MKTVFAPAAALMSRLKFPQRFSLITVLFLLPLVIALLMLLSRLNADIAFTRSEMQGTAYLRSTHTLLRHAINDWLLSRNALRGLGTGDEALAQNAAAIESDLASLAALDRQYGSALSTTEPLAAVQDTWRSMSALHQTIDRQVLYRAFILNINALIATVGDSSGLVLDSDLDTHYTMQAILVDLPKAHTTMSNLAVLGDAVVASRNLTEDEKAALNAFATQLLDSYDSMARDFQVAYANNPMGNLRPNVESNMSEAAAAVSALVDKLVLEVLTAPLITFPLDSWMDQARLALEAGYRQWDAQVDQLDVLLMSRVSSLEGTRNLAVVLTASVLLLVVYMWIGFYMAVMKTAAGLEQASALFASGSVTPNAIDLDSKDELSQSVASTLTHMATATNKMADTINVRTLELTEVSTLLAYMHDGVIITDADGTIKVLNPAATRMLGVGFGEAVNKPLSIFILDPRFHATLVTALAAPRQRHLVDIALNNRIVSVSAVFAPVSHDNYEGMLILEDVTELRTLQHLQQSRRPLPIR